MNGQIRANVVNQPGHAEVLHDQGVHPRLGQMDDLPLGVAQLTVEHQHVEGHERLHAAPVQPALLTEALGLALIAATMGEVVVGQWIEGRPRRRRGRLVRPRATHGGSGVGSEADRVQPLFISVDPERDAGAELAEFTSAFHPSILGLAGSPEATQAAAESFKVFFAREDDAAVIKIFPGITLPEKKT